MWIIDLTTQISTHVFLPRDNHRTSECNGSGLCVILILSHRIKNKYLKAKFNEISHFAASSRTFLSEIGIFLYNELVAVESTTATHQYIWWLCLFYRGYCNTEYGVLNSQKYGHAQPVNGCTLPVPESPPTPKMICHIQTRGSLFFQCLHFHLVTVFVGAKVLPLLLHARCQ